VQRLERPFLHAARIAFTHPTKQRRLEFTSPLPADLQSVLDDIRERQAPDEGWNP
jgi:23S rRNA pseudouridine1911/1915/1917 synthase